MILSILNKLERFVSSKKAAFFLLTYVFLSTQVLQARTIELPDTNAENVNQLNQRVFDRLGVKLKEKDETDGFRYHYSTSIWSGYNVNTYIGTFDDLTILRIESSPGQERAMTDIFLTESGQQTPSKTYSKKIPGLSPVFTLISPAFGHAYAYSGSPLGSTGKTILYSSALFLADSLLFLVGSTSFFQHSIDPFDRGLLATSILMGSYRLGAMPMAFRAEQRHNKMISAGYTFSF